MPKKKSLEGLTDAVYTSKTASSLEIKREPRYLLKVGTVSSWRVGPVSHMSLYLISHFSWKASRILEKESATECIRHIRTKVAALMQSAGP